MTRRSWSQGPNNPPKPDWPPDRPPKPKPSKLAVAEERLGAWLVRVLSTPVPAVWDGKGVR